MIGHIWGYWQKRFIYIISHLNHLLLNHLHQICTWKLRVSSWNYLFPLEFWKRYAQCRKWFLCNQQFHCNHYFSHLVIAFPTSYEDLCLSKAWWTRAGETPTFTTLLWWFFCFRTARLLWLLWLLLMLFTFFLLFWLYCWWTSSSSFCCQSERIQEENDCQ